MRKTLLVVLFLQSLVFGYAQSIVVNSSSAAESNYNAQQLLTDVLLDGGSCSSISNFQLRDNPSAPFPSAERSWGYFEKGNSNFPFQKGIVLTSGYAKNAEGPDSGIESEGNNDWTGDADATYLAGASTRNVTVFEFDFVPQGNEISFNYIFASEEYPQFACDSDYNDVFAFIISGPGITNDPGLSGKNIARLPNGLPVTINNVNDQGCGNSTYYVGGPFQAIEYGGRTVPLTAYSQVIPGQTYHIRLLVADAGDNQYDSAVFLEANSFNLGSTIVDDNGVDLGDNIQVCGQFSYTLYLNINDPNVQIQWYRNGTPIPGATGTSLVVTNSATYSVTVVNGDCTAEDEVNVLFGDLQTNGDNFELERLDQNGDGVEIFNLTLVQPEIVNNVNDHTFTYYTTQNDADNQTNAIPNPLAYTASHNTIVYVRVEHTSGCYAIVTLRLKVLEDCIPAQPLCANDDYGTNVPAITGAAPAPTGPDYDCLYTQPNPAWFYFKVLENGDIVFDLNQYTGENQTGTGIDVDFIVWGPFDEKPCAYTELSSDKVVDCSYSASNIERVEILNAQEGKFYILLITNYSGQAGYYNLILDESSTSGEFDCTIMGNASFSECDNDGDGQAQFDLNAIAGQINTNANNTVRFFATEDEATNDTGTPLASPYTVFANNSPITIYAQIKDELGFIVEIVKIDLSIYPGVTGFFNPTFTICDAGNDGVEIIDLTQIQVIGDTTPYTITYYESEASAIAGDANFIPNPTDYQASTSTIYVRIENENGCFSIARINIELETLEVDLGDSFAMCQGEFVLTASGDFTGYTGVTYTWFRNNTLIEGANEQTLTITQIGQYRVVVETAEGCSGTDTVLVQQGEAAEITDILVGLNNVQFDAAGGATPYQYSLTGYVWQDSNFFENLQPGIHTAYVMTAEGCITTQEFAIFQIPTMFTPNGDGINDTWRIPGLEIYPGSNVVIYDRQGRTVYQAELTSNVIWDGYFSNGQKAPTQDYWYIINVTDGRKFTGHVTVKSRGEKN